MNLKEIVKNIPGVMQIRNYQRAFSAPIGTIIDSHRMIKKYKNLYKGQRCFIIGNGPSLRAKDLEMIKDEISFAANTIYKIYQETTWRPTFFCIQDENVLREMLTEGVFEKVNKCKATFIRLYSSRIIRKHGLELNNLVYVPIVNKQTARYSAPFSEKVEWYAFDGSMVTYLSLQLAVYMGFDRIYLLGMDHNFPYSIDRSGNIIANDVNTVAHFWEGSNENQDSQRVLLHANYQEFADNSYREVENLSHKKGNFRIFNATRGGKLEIFERVNLEDIVKV